MQLTATTATRGPIDKSAWPKLQLLPADLPAPATGMRARQQVWARFSAGSIADHRLGNAGRVTPTWDWDATEPLLDAVRLVGKDPRAALAATVALAGQKHLCPDDFDRTHPQELQTAMGLYEAAGGWLYAVPLWITPGTNDLQHFYPIELSGTGQPDARFTFRDDRLMAVVGVDGFIANPAHAARFEA
jgi:hypothetical protein